MITGFQTVEGDTMSEWTVSGDDSAQLLPLVILLLLKVGQ